ncbi:DDE Tnp 1 7 domain containing protein, partial [Asbolus verrucosus]
IKQYVPLGQFEKIDWKDVPFQQKNIRIKRPEERIHFSEMISHPYIIASYNKGMGGVDKLDALVAVYRTRIRQR